MEHLFEKQLMSKLQKLKISFSERCFSLAGNTRSIKRTAFSDSKLEMMAVLKTIDYDLWSMVENDIGQ
jgi:hypothetical protein